MLEWWDLTEWNGINNRLERVAVYYILEANTPSLKNKYATYLDMIGYYSSPIRPKYPVYP